MPEYPNGVEAVDEYEPFRVPEVARIRLEHVYHRGSHRMAVLNDHEVSRRLRQPVNLIAVLPQGRDRHRTEPGRPFKGDRRAEALPLDGHYGRPEVELLPAPVLRNLGLTDDFR